MEGHESEKLLILLNMTSFSISSKYCSILVHYYRILELILVESNDISASKATVYCRVLLRRKIRCLESLRHLYN